MTWQIKPFLIKFLTAQGSAIQALLLTKTTDPWTWANVLLIGLLIALGVDTATFMDAKNKEDE